MSVEVQIVGFDEGERLRFAEIVQPKDVARVKAIANVPSSDPDLLGAYPLLPPQIAQIADAAHIAIDPTKFSYFLQAYEV